MQCENVVNGRVCGTCKACKSIHAGVCIDVKEMDGAANRGIDNAKALIEAAQWSPQEFKKKIYILDEVHQLSKEAISALLKIMEEPPSYLVFILCTTEANKILPTILSRCQRFNFSKISSKEISQRLMLISKNENINIEEDAIDIIAKMSRGSMRDAISYLEQIGTVASGKNITSSIIHRYFGITDRLAIFNIVKSILDGNVSLILDQVNDIMMASADCKQILYEVSEVFRNVMVIKAQNGNTKNIDLPDNEIQELRKIGEGLNISQILKLAHLFSDVDKKMSFNINERWIIEATLINCISSLKN
jgi:DNA polymerase-3 subunit gamma/tau